MICALAPQSFPTLVLRTDLSRVRAETKGAEDKRMPILKSIFRLVPFHNYIASTAGCLEACPSTAIRLLQSLGPPADVHHLPAEHTGMEIEATIPDLSTEYSVLMKLFKRDLASSKDRRVQICLFAHSTGFGGKTGKPFLLC